MAKLMLSLISLAVVLLCNIQNAQGSMDCKPFSNKNIVDQIVYTCPKPFFEQEKAYCCYDKEGNSFCCDLPEFVVSTGAYLIVALLIILLLTSLISCVCCLCCPCCCLYKRRQSGAVYRTPRQYNS